MTASSTWHMASLRFVWLGMLGALLLATGCRNVRHTTSAALPERSADELLDSLNFREPTWQTLGLRMESSAHAMDKEGSFTMNVRMAKDSVIWMSISPALGVEAARVLLTPDSVQVLSKLPGSRFVFLGGYDVLSDAMDAPVSFDLLQDLLLGQPLDMEDDEVYISKVDGDRYVLLSKYDRNVRKLVGTDDKGFAPGDSLAIVAKDKKAERLLEKAERKAEKKEVAADKLVVKRYWLDGVTFDPVKDVIDDLLQFRTVTVERENFEDTELGRLPNTVRMTVTSPDGDFDSVFETKRRRTGRAYDFPFSIPEGFERRTTL